MAFCCGGSASAGDATNKAIEKTLKEDKKRMQNEVKLLLLGEHKHTTSLLRHDLGAGESGKSTIAKQMKIIHKRGFTPEERASYKSIIWNNTVSAMRVLVNAANDLGFEIEAKVYSNYIQ